MKKYKGCQILPNSNDSITYFYYFSSTYFWFICRNFCKSLYKSYFELLYEASDQKIPVSYDNYRELPVAIEIGTNESDLNFKLNFFEFRTFIESKTDFFSVLSYSNYFILDEYWNNIYCKQLPKGVYCEGPLDLTTPIYKQHRTFSFFDETIFNSQNAITNRVSYICDCG